MANDFVDIYGYPVGFCFKLTVQGVDSSLQEVSGISSDSTPEEVAGGGENRFKYRLPTTMTSQNLSLKNVLAKEDSGLATWCTETIDNNLANPVQTNDVTISLLNAKGEQLVYWIFYNAYPVKYSASDFKSQESELVFETIELAYTYFKKTVVPQKN